MPNGRNFGRGFGLRGYAPSWPYVGRGRGGLPRCLAYGGAADLSMEMGYSVPGGFGYGKRPFYDSPLSSEQELSFLKNQAVMLRQQLEQLDVRIKELGKITH